MYFKVIIVVYVSHIVSVAGIVAGRVAGVVISLVFVVIIACFWRKQCHKKGNCIKLLQVIVFLVGCLFMCWHI